MQKEPPESEGAPERPFTAESAERSLRERRRAELEALRSSLEEAALHLAGEEGYRALTVRAILERTGANRARFYSLFESKADCYAAAYALASERLVERALRGEEDSDEWLDCFCRGIRGLADWIESDPATARGMLSEVHVAGGAAMAKRKEVFERLSRAIDRARRETSSRHSPPPTAADFILVAIETSAIRSLAEGDGSSFAASVPDLIHIAASLYFDRGRAAAAYREAKAGLR